MASAESKSSAFQTVQLRKNVAAGVPPLDTFNLVSHDKLPEPKEGELLVKVLVLSVDPYMRGRLGTDDTRSSSKPLKPGDVIPGATVGRVLKSNDKRYKAGDVVHAYSGWCSHYCKAADEVERVNTEWKIPLRSFVGAMGMTGLTAVYGLTRVGQVKQGETVVVSGAAGAVGSVVAQIAKNVFGCRVIAFAGSAKKIEYLEKELGVDVAINYKTEKNLGEALDRALQRGKNPKNGIDVYYDNTGGAITDAVLPRINYKARIVVCGQISCYSDDPSKPSVGPRLLHNLLWKCARMEGFLVQEFEKHDQETYAQLAKWIKEGKLKPKEDVELGGLAKAPAAFLKLFSGANFGKQVVIVSQEEGV